MKFDSGDFSATARSALVLAQQKWPHPAQNHPKSRRVQRAQPCQLGHGDRGVSPCSAPLLLHSGIKSRENLERLEVQESFKVLKKIAQSRQSCFSNSLCTGLLHFMVSFHHEEANHDPNRVLQGQASHEKSAHRHLSPFIKASEAELGFYIHVVLLLWLLLLFTL